MAVNYHIKEAIKVAANRAGALLSADNYAVMRRFFFFKIIFSYFFLF